MRNPQRSSTPPRRDSRNRYAWVYALEGGRSGWVRADVLVTDPGGWADGPAHADFEVGAAPGVRHAPRRRPRPRFTIGRRGSGRRVVDERDLYLRYAARSTAFSLPRSRRRRRAAVARVNYACVEVIASAHAPEGARGWVASGALRAP